MMITYVFIQNCADATNAPSTIRMGAPKSNLTMEDLLAMDWELGGKS